MNMPAIKNKLFHEIIKRLTREAGNVSISTKVRLESEGWVDVDGVYEYTLLPLISASKRICLAGYRPDWLESVPGDFQPGSEWALQITESAEKVNRYYYLPRDAAADPKLKNFWVQPYIYVPRIDGFPGNSVVRPAAAVFEFDVDELPSGPLVQNIVSISTISNLWSGGRCQAAAKRWSNASSNNSGSVFLPYKDLGNFTFNGSAGAIGRLVDKLMTKGGLAQRYDEFSSEGLLENLACKEGEGIDECVGRIISNYL